MSCAGAKPSVGAASAVGKQPRAEGVGAQIRLVRAPAAAFFCEAARRVKPGEGQCVVPLV